MADASKTVRVNGLPADVDEDRLRDKLFIHFLRARNGGGEIESVTVGKATPISALITFEDHRGQLGWTTARDCAYQVLRLQISVNSKFQRTDAFC